MRYTRSQADRLAEALQALPAAAPQRLFNKLEMVSTRAGLTLERSTSPPVPRRSS